MPVADSYNSGFSTPGVVFIGTERIEYFDIAKDRFYDASSFDPNDNKSSGYAKDLNKLVKKND